MKIAREIREELKLTMYEMAKVLGVGSWTYNVLENQSQSIKTETIHALWEIAKMQLDWSAEKFLRRLVDIEDTDQVDEIANRVLDLVEQKREEISSIDPAKLPISITVTTDEIDASLQEPIQFLRKHIMTKVERKQGGNNG